MALYFYQFYFQVSKPLKDLLTIICNNSCIFLRLCFQTDNFTLRFQGEECKKTNEFTGFRPKNSSENFCSLSKEAILNLKFHQKELH